MLERPIFIVAPPGSGASLLLSTLGQSPSVTPLEHGLDALIESHRLDAIPANGSHRLLAASQLRVPLLRSAFPGARFVFLYQEPREGAAATEWASTASVLLDDLEQLPAGEWCVVSFERLVSNPQEEAQRLCRFLEIEWDQKTEQNRDVIAPIAARVRDVFARPSSDPSPFRSVSTRSFAEILHRLGISLLVTTYQSGRMIAVRAENATTLNTHLKLFRSPMGLAIGDGRFALGTEREVWDYRNQPAVTAKVDPPGRHDAVFVPRNVHYTGDIRIHEIGYAGGELWIVNTRFSTLCTLDSDSSFVPRWRPKFVTHLAPEDRCHLNGMAIVDDRVRYVTALGITNVAGGWREKKNTGGVLIDVDSHEIVLSGLSMPHSPRKYGDRFWILESAKGTFAAVDLTSGKVETIAELPGFTRGLAFAGRFAFIGLSQVRESNIFGGIPLVDRVKERECGVWVVDLQSGKIAAFLRFQGIVQEIFDVQVLPGIRYPEILEPTDKLVAVSYTLPDEVLGDLSFSLREKVPRSGG